MYLSMSESSSSGSFYGIGLDGSGLEGSCRLVSFCLGSGSGSLRAESRHEVAGLFSPPPSLPDPIDKPEPSKARGHLPGGSYVPKSNIDFSSLKSLDCCLGLFKVSRGTLKGSSSSSSSV